MTLSDDEDEFLAQFLESEVLSGVSDQEKEKAEEAEAEEERQPKKLRVGKDDKGNLIESTPVASAAIQLQATKGEMIVSNNIGNSDNRRSGATLARIDTGVFGKVPPELFHHILKFLSSEDLVSCSLACRFLNYAASDESLWRRLYCMRWGLLYPTTKFRESAWKKLYIQRDEEDMAEFVRNCPSEFKEYYIQMQAAKRSQTPLPSQVNDDRIILDKTLADQVSIWKSSRGLTDKVFLNHDCSGDTCTYYQIGDVYVCEKTGHVHVCDDTCREAILDPTNELLVCRISGHCFDRLLSPDEMEPDIEQQQGGADEAEPFMGSGRFGRAYLLGYNCADEKELNAVLRFC